MILSQKKSGVAGGWANKIKLAKVFIVFSYHYFRFNSWEMKRGYYCYPYFIFQFIRRQTEKENE